jgi:hypothetical protein
MVIASITLSAAFVFATVAMKPVGVGTCSHSGSMISGVTAGSAQANEFERTLSRATKMFRVNSEQLSVAAVGASTHHAVTINAAIARDGARDMAPNVHPDQTEYVTAQELQTVAQAVGAKSGDMAPTNHPDQTEYVTAQELQTVAQAVGAN